MPLASDWIKAIRRGTLTPVRDLVRLTSEEFGNVYTAYEESGVLIEYLIAGQGARKKLTRDLLSQYIQRAPYGLDLFDIVL